MSKLAIRWGSSATSPVSKTHYRASFQNYTATYGDIFVPQQVHGILGHILTKELISTWSSQPLIGDYLITQEPNIWLGTLTADCLPIVFYDPKQAVIAIAHAGWRGSVAGIAQVVFNNLVQNFGVNSQDLQIYFGPSSGTCCYEVKPDFIANLGQNTVALECVEKQGQRYFFDVLRYNMLCLQNCNVPAQNFNLDGHVCTICNIEYCSYRRDNENTGLQLSLCALR